VRPAPAFAQALKRREGSPSNLSDKAEQAAPFCSLSRKEGGTFQGASRLSTHACTHARACSHTHAQHAPMLTHPHAHAHKHACLHAYAHTCTHTYALMCVLSQVQRGRGPPKGLAQSPRPCPCSHRALQCSLQTVVEGLAAQVCAEMLGFGSQWFRARQAEAGVAQKLKQKRHCR